MKIYEFFRYDVPFVVKDFLYEIKMKYQLVTRGYSDRNVYSMCDDMATLNIKLLTALRDNGHGNPYGLTKKKWKAILTKMIEGFETVDTYSWDLSKSQEKKNQKKFEEGMELYAKWYKNLWD